MVSEKEFDEKINVLRDKIQETFEGWLEWSGLNENVAYLQDVLSDADLVIAGANYKEYIGKGEEDEVLW